MYNFETNIIAKALFCRRIKVFMNYWICRLSSSIMSERVFKFTFDSDEIEHQNKFDKNTNNDSKLMKLFTWLLAFICFILKEKLSVKERLKFFKIQKIIIWVHTIVDRIILYSYPHKESVLGFVRKSTNKIFRNKLDNLICSYVNKNQTKNSYFYEPRTRYFWNVKIFFFLNIKYLEIHTTLFIIKLCVNPK